MGYDIAGASKVASGETEANLERANAGIADQQAKSEMSAAGYNANLVRLRGGKALGQIVSGSGANNLQQGGTVQRNVEDTARATELGAITTSNNALRRAWGFEVQGASDRTQAGLDEGAGLLSGLGSFTSSPGGQAAVGSVYNTLFVS
jgi:hypothetical protein